MDIQTIVQRRKALATPFIFLMFRKAYHLLQRSMGQNWEQAANEEPRKFVASVRNPSLFFTLTLFSKRLLFTESILRDTNRSKRWIGTEGARLQLDQRES